MRLLKEAIGSYTLRLLLKNLKAENDVETGEQVSKLLQGPDLPRSVRCSVPLKRFAKIRACPHPLRSLPFQSSDSLVSDLGLEICGLSLACACGKSLRQTLEDSGAGLSEC